MFKRLFAVALTGSFVAALPAGDQLPPPKIDPVPKPLASDPSASVTITRPRPSLTMRSAMAASERSTSLSISGASVGSLGIIRRMP